MSIGNILQKAFSAVYDVATNADMSKAASTLKETASSGASNWFTDIFEKKSDSGGGGLFSKLGNLLGGSIGTMLNKALDSLGLPDWVGDIAGAAVDFCTGNYVGAVANGLDALEDVARACGGDELAGFLKAGSDITNMFAPTSLGNLGKVGELASSAKQVTSQIETGLSVVDNLKNGDIAGAASGVLSMFGGELQGSLGALGNALPSWAADNFTDDLARALGNGGCSRPASDLKNEIFDALKRGGLPGLGRSSTRSSLLSQAFEMIKHACTVAGGSKPGAPGFPNLPPEAMRIIGPGNWKPQNPLHQLIERAIANTLSQLNLCSANEELARQILDVLLQKTSMAQGVDLCSHLGATLRV